MRSHTVNTESAIRTHVILPTSLVREVDRLIGQRKRSEFIQDALVQKLTLLKQQQAFTKAKGVWKKHPNFKTDSDVKKIIQSTRKAVDHRLDYLNS